MVEEESTVRGFPPMYLFDRGDNFTDTIPICPPLQSEKEQADPETKSAAKKKADRVKAKVLAQEAASQQRHYENYLRRQDPRLGSVPHPGNAEHGRNEEARRRQQGAGVRETDVHWPSKASHLSKPLKGKGKGRQELNEEPERLEMIEEEGHADAKLRTAEEMGAVDAVHQVAQSKAREKAQEDANKKKEEKEVGYQSGSSLRIE